MRHKREKGKRAEDLNSEIILQNAQKGHYNGQSDVCERGPIFGDAVKKQYVQDDSVRAKTDGENIGGLPY